MVGEKVWKERDEMNGRREMKGEERKERRVMDWNHHMERRLTEVRGVLWVALCGVGRIRLED